MSRQAYLAAGLAAVVPVVAATLSVGAAADTGPVRFAPPERAILTRTVWRYLSDGQQIVVTRRYAVEFARAGEGYRLDGALIEALVDAPSDLAAFAELERRRPDTTTFPIVLDRTGRILSDGRMPDPATREQGAALARKTIGGAAIDAQTRTQALGQIAMLSTQSAISPVPGDLFQPLAGERRETRKVALPGGAEGEVEVALRVDVADDGNLPQQVERVVTTRLAGTTKVSREVWAFSR